MDSSAERPDAGRRSYEVPFAIRFGGPLSGRRLGLLVSELDIHTQVQPKQQPPVPFGTAQLDSYTGLYLLRGATDEDWILECRAYRAPAPDWLRQQYLRVVWVIEQLDSDLEVSRT